MIYERFNLADCDILGINNSLIAVLATLKTGPIKAHTARNIDLLDFIVYERRMGTASGLSFRQPIMDIRLLR